MARLSDVSLEVTVIVLVIAGFAFVLGLIVYHKRVFKRKVHATTNRKAAFSLGGNFVEDLKVPIETKYRVTSSVLGSGSSAQVVVGEDIRTNRKYAIKVIDLSRHEVAWRYEREKNFLRDIEHTNVVRLYEVYSSPQALYFVMELCTGGHLGQVLRASPEGRLDESVAQEYILQLTRAISHCHHHGICHRDVKLQNVLLESSSKDAQVKLVDFGNGARFRNNLPLKKVVGTTYTAAPEVFKECYDERCDVWSLGVVTYILLSGRRPFEKMEVNVTQNGQTRKKEESVVASILMGRYHFDHEVWDDVSNDAINFIRHCFVLDYTKRCTAAAILEHPWLTKDDDFLPSDKIRKLSFCSSDTLRRTLGREMASPLGGIRQISMLAVAFARPTEKVQQLRKVFQEVDHNGSGMIEMDEFMTAMKLMNPDLPSTQTNDLFQRIDQDGNHCISFIEFLAATLDPEEVDASELREAFRLIDHEHKGYISREDVHRILCTTNVEDFEYAQEQARGTAGHSGSHSTLAASSNPSAGAGFAGLSANSTRRTSTLEASGSGRSTQAMDDAIELRSKRLEQRIDEIMEQADVNKDGVISLDEFMYSMAGGDATRFPVQRENDEGAYQVEVNLVTAPAIVHKVHRDESFVTSLKRKISEGNILFISSGDFAKMKSFPVRRKPTKEAEAANKPWFSFHIPFVGSFHSKQTIVAAATAQQQHQQQLQAGAAGAYTASPEGRDRSGSQNSPNAKEVSIVSKFEEFERHSSVHSMHSVHSLHSLPSARSNATPKDGEHARENSTLSVPRRLSGSEDVEAPSLRRFASSSARHSLSQSSKGPSWIEKGTPTSSFLLGGAMTGAVLPSMLPNFTWSHKKPPRRYEQLDIEAVIAKLEHSGRPHEIALRMNHDDPGLLGDPTPTVPPRASLVMTVEEGAEGTEAESRKQEGHGQSGGGATERGVADPSGRRHFSEEKSGRHSPMLEMVDHVEEDIETGHMR